MKTMHVPVDPESMTAEEVEQARVLADQLSAVCSDFTAEQTRVALLALLARVMQIEADQGMWERYGLEVARFLKAIAEANERADLVPGKAPEGPDMPISTMN